LTAFNARRLMATSLLFRIQVSRLQGLETNYETWSASLADLQCARDLLVLVEECRHQTKEGSRLWERTKGVSD
jgi:hypothetical protein